VTMLKAESPRALVFTLKLKVSQYGKLISQGVLPECAGT
jgi:hypothetical protein